MGIVIIILAYLFGSIPLGYIFGKIKGRDIRKEGSGNIGFTNVCRVLGKRWGIPTLIFDILKGFLFPFISFKLGLGEKIAILSSLFAILGQGFSIFLRFKGGKGVATSAGVFLALAPIEVAITIAIFLVIFSIFRLVSIGSIVSSISLPILVFFISPNKRLVFVFSLVAMAFILIKHIPNIKRLIGKREYKI
ncbi:MAG: glycerol-3-phosphate 1-O-acyltransferase PlsY [bacterium]